MRKARTLLLILLVSPIFSVAIFSQDGIKALFENEEYKEIIDNYAGKPRTLSAEDLTYIAQAYLKLELPNDALTYANLAIQKTPKYAKAYYVKALVYSQNEQYNEAIGLVQKAIENAPREGEYYTVLGDLYQAAEQPDNALANYKKAIAQLNPAERAYYMIATIYTDQDKQDEALKALYIAKSKITKDKELYVTTLYNIASMEYNNHNYKNAIAAYKELVDHFPDDYYSLEKLVQCCYAQDEYNEGNTYRQKLYNAYEKGELAATSLHDMYCVSHFNVGSEMVSAYERFEKPANVAMNKYLFYVLGNDGTVDSTITLEYTPPRMQGAKGSCRLIQSKDGNSYNFGLIIDQDSSFEALKQLVTDVIEGKIKPVG